MKNNKSSSIRFSCVLSFVLILILVVSCAPQDQITSTPEILPTQTEVPTVLVEPTPTAFVPPLLLTNPQEVSPQMIGSNHQFRFTFNQPVNAESFETTFTIQPELDGDFQWEDETTVVFTPAKALPLGTHFTITLPQDLYAQSGGTFPRSIQQNYITLSPLSIGEIFPENLSVDVDIHTPLWISFNQPIASQVTDDEPVPFTITPAVPGAGRWVNTSTYIFYPSEALLSETDYTITINPILKSQFGAGFAAVPEQWTFVTQSPAVTAIEPADLSILEPGQNILISFNQPMDPDSVVANLRLEDANADEILPEMQWNEDSTQLTLVGGEVFSRGDTILLVLNPAAKSRSGIALKESSRRQYTTTPSLAFDETPESSLEVSPNGYATLRFHANVPLNPDQDFISLIDIRNKTPGEFTAELDESHQVLTYSGFFLPGTFYSYSLSPDLVDRWSQPLGEVVFSRFATQSAPSSILIQQEPSPPSHIFFPLNDFQISIETNNIRRVDMQSIPLTIENYIRLYCNESDCLSSQEFEYTRFWYQSVYPYIVNTLIPSEISMAPRFRSLDSGIYVFELNSPDLKSREPLHYFGIAANVVLSTQQLQDTLLVWAIDINTLEPIANAPVTVYDHQGNIVKSGNTDAQGLQTVKELESGMYHVSLNQPGDEQFGFTTVTILENSEDERTVTASEAAFFFDRTTYYPGDRVNFLVHLNEDSSSEHRVQLVYQYEEQESILEELVFSFAPGSTTQGAVAIPELLPLGRYSLRLPDDGVSHEVPVTEIVPGDVSIDVQWGKDAYYSFDSEIVGTLLLRDENAIPIAHQTLQWEASALPQLMLAGECVTDEKGACPLNIMVEDLRIMAGDDLAGFQIQVTNENLGAMATTAIPLYPAPFTVEILPETWLGQAGEMIGIEVVSRDWLIHTAQPAALEARFEKITFVDESSYQSGKEVINQMLSAEQIASTSFSTDENGYARLTFTPPDAGLYRISIHQGEFIETSWIYVNGDNYAQWLENNETIFAITDKEIYLPGDSAQIFLPNPFMSPTKALLTIRNNTSFREQFVTIDGAGEIVDFVVKTEDMPSFSITVSYVGQQNDGRIGYRESMLTRRVIESQPALSIESDLELTAQGKGLLKINTTEDGIPAAANYSLLILPTAWLQTQPFDQVFFSYATNLELLATTTNPLKDYIRVVEKQPVWMIDTHFVSASLTAEGDGPYQGTDTIFLTNLSTTENGDAFIEFPFDAQQTDYTFFINVISEKGVTAYQQGAVSLPAQNQAQVKPFPAEVFSNALTSPGQVEIPLPIQFGQDAKDWKLDLFVSDLSAIQSFGAAAPMFEDQPLTIAASLLSSFSLNEINGGQESLEGYVDLLETTQQEDGGWGFLTGKPSDPVVTNFIAFSLLESGTISLLSETNRENLESYLQLVFADDTEAQAALSASLLQGITLEYQDVSRFVEKANDLTIIELVFLVQALSQQSDSEAALTEMLTLLLENTLQDEYGAYFSADIPNSPFASSEALSALVLLTLDQAQPGSEIIPQLRGWLIHRGLTTDLSKTPTENALILLALQRSMHLSSTEGVFNVQIKNGTGSPQRLSSAEIGETGYSQTITVDAAAPLVSIIHEEGDGVLYYRISSEKEYSDMANGIVLTQHFYPLEAACRPGNCEALTEFAVTSDDGLVESRLTVTVIENLHQVVIELPLSEDFEILLPSERLVDLAPPISSPLEHGLGQNFFTATQEDGTAYLYAPTLPAGTYELIIYLKPLKSGELQTPAISVYGAFNGICYARLSPNVLTINLEETNE